MGLCRTIWNRIHFARQLYLWGSRWVVFVMWGLPYAVIGVYDTAIGQGFLPSNYPKLAPLIPDWLPQAWLYVGIVLLFAVTFEGAYRIVQKERNKNQTVDDTVAFLAKLIRECEGLSIVKATSLNPELDKVCKEAIIWAIKAITYISERVGMVAENTIRSELQLPLEGKIKEEDFHTPYTSTDFEHDFALVRNRCYEIKSWMKDYIQQASLNSGK